MGARWILYSKHKPTPLLGNTLLSRAICQNTQESTIFDFLLRLLFLNSCDVFHKVPACLIVLRDVCQFWIISANHAIHYIIRSIVFKPEVYFFPLPFVLSLPLFFRNSFLWFFLYFLLWASLFQVAFWIADHLGAGFC